MSDEEIRAGRWVYSGQGGEALLGFVAQSLRVTRRKAKYILDSRQVFVNQRRVWMAKHALSKGDIVEIHQFQRPQKESFREPKIIYQDDQVMAFDKPCGLCSTGKGSLEDIVRNLYPEALPVHRLDEDTTGCILFAKNQQAFEKMKEIFEKHQIRKFYRALAAGAFSQSQVTIQKPVDGKLAVTKIRLLKKSKTVSYLECELVTGRKHQIRIHLAHIGHPVVGEELYNTGQIFIPLLRHIPRQMLHAHRIEFESPWTGAPLSITAPLPLDFVRTMKRLL